MNEGGFAGGLPSSDAAAWSALKGVRTIAVIGLSPQPEKASNRVARYAQAQGFKIIPVYPDRDEILGEKAYPSLTAYGRPVDLVDIFRRPDAVSDIVDEAIRLGCKCIWMQEGISNAPAADKARAAGLKVVENRCLQKVLAGGKNFSSN